MKKVVFLVIAVMFALCSAAQDTLNDIVTITLPAKAKILTKDQFLTYEHYGFKYSRFRSMENDNRFYTNMYSIYGVLLRFFDLNISPDDTRTLQQIQQEMINRINARKIHDTKINYSKIITVNDIQFLVYEYQTADEEYLRFMSDKLNNKVITGLFEFKETNEDNAQRALNELLNSMHFKN